MNRRLNLSRLVVPLTSPHAHVTPCVRVDSRPWVGGVKPDTHHPLGMMMSPPPHPDQPRVRAGVDSEGEHAQCGGKNTVSFRTVM